MRNRKKVAVIMGSDSDLPVLKDCFSILKEFDVPFEARVISAHRTPDTAAKFAKGASAAGFGVIIAAAGKAAHLAGVMASMTTLPVIGIPVKSSTMDGLDSLLSVVQMPKGVPVATVAIDGAANAALLAVQMLGIGDRELKKALKDYKDRMAEQIAEKDEKLQAELAQS